MAEQAIPTGVAALVPASPRRTSSTRRPPSSAQGQTATAPSAADAEPVEATIQVDVYATRPVASAPFSALTEAVRAVLQRQSTGNVIDMSLEAERDDFEDDTDLFRKSFDVRAWYRET